MIVKNLHRCLLGIFFLGFFLGLLHRPLYAQSEINIYVAEPRGGRGDVAANLLMARRLQKLRPYADIRLLVPSQSIEIAKFLEPHWTSSKAQTVDGIKFIPLYPGAEVPKAEAILSFSADGDELPHRVADSAPWILLFEEPDDAHTRLVRAPEWHQRYDGDSPQLNQMLFLTTGFGNLGAYVTPEGADRKPLSEIVTRLSDETGIPRSELPIDSSSILASGYASNSEVSRAYIEFSLEMARRKFNQKVRRPLVFLLNHRGWADEAYHVSPLAVEPNRIYELGSETYLIPYARLSLGLSEDLMGASDLPPLATGDGSKAMAIEHGRAFMYELQGWKEGSHDAFISSLALNPKIGSLDRKAMTFEIVENDQYQLAQRGKPHGPLTVVNEGLLLRIRPELEGELDSSIAETRREGSLAKNVWTLVDELRKVPPAQDAKQIIDTGVRLDAFAKKFCASALERLKSRWTSARPRPMRML